VFFFTDSIQVSARPERGTRRAAPDRSAVLPFDAAAQERRFADKRAGVKIDRDPVVRFEDVRAYRKFTEEWLPKAAAQVEGPLIVWTNFLGKEPIRSVARALGYAEAGEFVWAKQGSQQEVNEQLLRVYETALVFTAKPLPPPRPEDAARVWCVAAGYDDEGEAGRWGSHPNHKPFSVLEPWFDSGRAPASSSWIPSPAVAASRPPRCACKDARHAARLRRSGPSACRAALRRSFDEVLDGTGARHRMRGQQAHALPERLELLPGGGSEPDSMRGKEMAKVECYRPEDESCGALAVHYADGERVFLFRPPGFEPGQKIPWCPAQSSARSWLRTAAASGSSRWRAGATTTGRCSSPRRALAAGGRVRDLPDPRARSAQHAALVVRPTQ